MYFDTLRCKAVQRRQISTGMTTASCETVTDWKDFEVTVARVMNWRSEGSVLRKASGIPGCGSSGLESDFYLQQLSNCFPINTLLTVLLQTLCVIKGGILSLSLLFMLLQLNVIGRRLWSRRTGTQAISQIKASKYRTFSPEMVCGQGRLVLLELLVVPCSFSVWRGGGFHTTCGGRRESCDPCSWDAFL